MDPAGVDEEKQPVNELVNIQPTKTQEERIEVKNEDQKTYESTIDKPKLFKYRLEQVMIDDKLNPEKLDQFVELLSEPRATLEEEFELVTPLLLSDTATLEKLTADYKVLDILSDWSLQSSEKISLLRVLLSAIGKIIKKVPNVLPMLMNSENLVQVLKEFRAHSDTACANHSQEIIHNLKLIMADNTETELIDLREALHERVKRSSPDFPSERDTPYNSKRPLLSEKDIDSEAIIILPLQLLPQPEIIDQQEEEKKKPRKSKKRVTWVPDDAHDVTHFHKHLPVRYNGKLGEYGEERNEEIVTEWRLLPIRFEPSSQPALLNSVKAVQSGKILSKAKQIETERQAGESIVLYLSDADIPPNPIEAPEAEANIVTPTTAMITIPYARKKPAAASSAASSASLAAGAVAPSAGTPPSSNLSPSSLSSTASQIPILLSQGQPPNQAPANSNHMTTFGQQQQQQQQQQSPQQQLHGMQNQLQQNYLYQHNYNQQPNSLQQTQYKQQSNQQPHHYQQQIQQRQQAPEQHQHSHLQHNPPPPPPPHLHQQGQQHPQYQSSHYQGMNLPYNSATPLQMGLGPAGGGGGGASSPSSPPSSSSSSSKSLSLNNNPQAQLSPQGMGNASGHAVFQSSNPMLTQLTGQQQQQQQHHQQQQLGPYHHFQQQYPPPQQQQQQYLPPKLQQQQYPPQYPPQQHYPPQQQYSQQQQQQLPQQQYPHQSQWASDSFNFASPPSFSPSPPSSSSSSSSSALHLSSPMETWSPNYIPNRKLTMGSDKSRTSDQGLFTPADFAPSAYDFRALASPNFRLKKDLCKFWKREGRCNKGATCRFLHTRGEPALYLDRH